MVYIQLDKYKAIGLRDISFEIGFILYKASSVK